MLEDVLDSSQELFGADAAGLWQLQPRRQPFELVAHRDLGQELIDAVAAIYEDDDVIGLPRDRASAGAIVLADPAGAPRLRPDLRAARVPDRQLRPARCSATSPSACWSSTTARPYDWSPDELELCTSFANQMATAFANARLFATRPRGRGPAARDPGALVAAQPDPGRQGDRRGDRGRGRPADPPRHDPRLQRRRGRPACASRSRSTASSSGIGTLDRGRAPAPDRRGADGLGRRSTTETIRLGDAGADPRGLQVGSRPRRGVDAAGADVLRVARAGRDRRVEGGLRPVRRGRPADARDLRRLRGPGGGQRRGVRAGPPPAARSSTTGSRASAACSRSTSGCSPPSTRAACSR